MNRHVQVFESWRGQKPVTGALLLAFHAHLIKRYPAPSSRNRVLQAVAPYLRKQRLQGLHTLSNDDLDEALPRFTVDRRDPEILTADQVRALVNAAADLAQAMPDYARLVALGLTAGARLGELVMLRGQSFRPEDKPPVLRVFATKTRRDRRVPLKFSTTLQAFAHVYAGNPNRVLSFAGPRGHPKTSEWRKLCHHAGLPDLEPRIMRRTVDSFAGSSGLVPMRWLSEWLGHTERVALSHYALTQDVATGATIEHWYGCPDAFDNLTAALLGLRDAGSAAFAPREGQGGAQAVA